MSVALLHRLLTGLAIVAALAGAVFLQRARSDERALERAREALSRNDPAAALSQLRDVGDGTVVRGRAATLEARASLLTGDVRRGLDALRRAVDARPNDWQVRRELAVALAAVGDVAGARAQAVRTLELNPRAVLPSGFKVRSGGR